MQADDLKALRKNMGLSQAELATALGLTGTYIGMMERGEKAIEMRTAWLVRMLANDMAARESLALQVEQMANGNLRSFHNNVDTTQESLARARKQLVDTIDRIERIL